MFIRNRSGLTFGHSLSVKSQFPGDDRLRLAFRQRLETIAAENARMILSALTPPDTVPHYSEADLLPVSDVIKQVLQAWDNRLTDIQSRYQNHPQRILPLRSNMEDRTALAFAGLINHLRQEDLGIERYVWATQGDHKVRSAHAALNVMSSIGITPPRKVIPGRHRIAGAARCRCRVMGQMSSWQTIPLCGSHRRWRILCDTRRDCRHRADFGGFLRGGRKLSDSCSLADDGG